MSKKENDSDTSIYLQDINIQRNDKKTLFDACLVIILGNEENKKFNLFNEKESIEPIKEINNTINIGRENIVNEIVIEDKFVSHKHASIIQKGSKFFIKDNDSTNGTFVNEELIKGEFSLNNQDRIRIGNTILKFLQGDIESLFLDNLMKKINIDGLTDIYNKQYFTEQFKNIFSLSKRYNKKFSLILFDIDDFKKINDNYGHSLGDFILSKLCMIIKNRIRETDIFSRIGGEEFTIICPETNLDNSLKLSNKLIKIVGEFPFIFKKNIINITISIGICEITESFNDENEMFDYCDSLLFKSKNQGKNRVTTI